MMDMGHNLLAASVSLSIPQGSGFANLQNLDIGGLVSIAVNGIIIIAVLIFFFQILLGGIKWMTSMGDKGKTEAARSHLVAALVGIIIVFSVWAIASFVETEFGVQILFFNLSF